MQQQVNRGHITSALDNAGGIIRGEDAIAVLIRHIDSRCHPTRNIVRREVERLEDAYQIVVERDQRGKKFLLIATVDAYNRHQAAEAAAQKASAEEDEPSGEVQGFRLDAAIDPKPRKITLDTPGVKEKIEETADAVIDQLRDAEADFMARNSVIELVRVSTRTMHKDPLIINQMVGWVMTDLIGREILVRSAEHEDGTGVVYVLHLPVQTEEDLFEETLTRCEELTAELTELNRLWVEAEAASRRHADRADGLATANTELTRRIEALGVAHASELDELRAEHARQIAALGSDHQAALDAVQAEVTRLESELAARKKPALDSTTRQRLKRVGVRGK